MWKKVSIRLCISVVEVPKEVPDKAAETLVSTVKETAASSETEGGVFC